MVAGARERGDIDMDMIVNFLLDIKARIDEKPVWKVVVDLSPEELIKLIVFT